MIVLAAAIIVALRMLNSDDAHQGVPEAGPAQPQEHRRQAEGGEETGGTIDDPMWKIPMSGHHTSGRDNAAMSITSPGFGMPHPRRRIAAFSTAGFEGDRQADYFLFDDADRRSAVALNETYSKTCLDMIGALTPCRRKADRGRGAGAELGLKTMSTGRVERRENCGRSSRGNMREDGSQLREFEAKGPSNGDGPGVTFLESMSRSMMTMMDERFWRGDWV